MKIVYYVAVEILGLLNAIFVNLYQCAYHANEVLKPMINPFTGDPVKALHFAILV